jgi:hypothetical protein
MMRIMHDGSSYGSAPAGSEGSIWIPSGGVKRIYYVDQNRTIRRTKLGVTTRTQYDTSIGGNVGTGNAGYIWIDYGDDHFLYCVASDGYVFRLGAGYLSGDSQ